MHPAPRPTFPWWIVLCLVGLDYFSSLAYLPSIAFNSLGPRAPIAGIAVALVTLFLAVPVYLYVVSRSPDGKGGLGLLERVASGWSGKILLLVLLGFVATDFVLTRSLSVSDAATHLLYNPHYRDQAEKFLSKPQAIREALPVPLQGSFFEFWTEQLVITVFLSVLGFSFYWMLRRGLSNGFMGFAVGVVVLYLALNIFIIGSGLLYLHHHPEYISNWETDLRPMIGDYRAGMSEILPNVLLFCVLAFPSLAMGLSGFELSLASANLINPGPNDTPDNPKSRIFSAQILIISAALIMSLLVVSGLFVTTLLIPPDATFHDGKDIHRALAYFAHGGEVRGGQGDELNSMFGSTFGTLYDLCTITILCLSGAAATISLKEMVPEFLSRFGMQLSWAHRLDVITHLFNVTILLVTVYFQASVTSQLGAYAAAVLALLFGASLAATLDVGKRFRGLIRRVLQLPFALATILFAIMGVLIIYQQGSGVLIALAFIAVVLTTALVSRALRSNELRFQGFDFTDEFSANRWAEICKLEFQVLVPHNPKREILKNKEALIRENHRIPQTIPIIFIEVWIGDPSDFYQRPLMSISTLEGREVIRVSRCTSVSHVIAAIGLAFREVGRPPEIHFTWSEDTPLAATFGFLLFGQGNIPWLVHSIIKQGEREEARRPRVLIG